MRERGAWWWYMLEEELRLAEEASCRRQCKRRLDPIAWCAIYLYLIGLLIGAFVAVRRVWVHG